MTWKKLCNDKVDWFCSTIRWMFRHDITRVVPEYSVVVSGFLHNNIIKTVEAMIGAMLRLHPSMDAMLRLHFLIGAMVQLHSLMGAIVQLHSLGWRTIFDEENVHFNLHAFGSHLKYDLQRFVVVVQVWIHGQYYCTFLIIWALSSFLRQSGVLWECNTFTRKRNF